MVWKVLTGLMVIQHMSASHQIPMQTATFAGGCFWCIEAVFESLNGVEKVQSGYSGGWTDHPDYKSVCSGNTGHAEVVQVTFNPGVITYPDLLTVFFSVHDPTTLNRQGNDIGTQYRSAIFYHNEDQRMAAEKKIKELEISGEYGGHIVTEIVPFTKFHQAEDYHQGYYEANPNQSYCRIVVGPKVEKFRKKFKERLKP